MSSSKKTYPILFTINSGSDKDGISRVTRLLWRVLSKASNGSCRHINLLPEGKIQATAIDQLKFARVVLAEHLKGRIDWIMYDHLGPARVQSLVPRALHRPYALFLHSIEAWSPLSAGRERVLREATVRIANSHFTARRVAEAHPSVGPIEVCHLALLPSQAVDEIATVRLNEDETSPLAAHAPASKHELDELLLNRVRENSVLIVGRMVSSERHKGHDYLIEAWPLVKAQIPDAQLIIVGYGDDVPRLKAKVEERGLTDDIIFACHVSDATLKQLYERVAVFCMPSNGEGFGLVYLEAMQHRLPCIASPADAAAEIVEDGITGLLIRQTEVARLAQGIAGLLANPARRREMGEAGYARWQNHFKFENFERRLLTILEKSFPLTPIASVEETGKLRPSTFE
ncbi:MAG: glycosyltransferase family 4 protein [Pyrinomonadaceae bacterium]|nr:glycosyltransferase family 4 protein [Pyrinomonadaceae bacterium]